MRLKCVCKHWHALIRDYGFHKKHYRFQYARQDVKPIFLNDFSQTKFYLLSRHEGDDVFMNLTDDFKRDNTPSFANDPALQNRYLYCMGIVNGIVGLEWGPPNLNERFALWNPTTRDYKSLSRWPIRPDNLDRVTDARILGFGFDPYSDDFKILGMYTFTGKDDNDGILQCQLYSLKANSWKTLRDAPRSSDMVIYSDVDTYFNDGVYYWDGKYDDSQVILAFKFSTGTFKEFELPEVAYNNPRVRLGKYKEGLALFVSHILENNDRHFEIWAATELDDDNHGCPLSWQLVFTVGPISSFIGYWVAAVRECGDLLVLTHCENRDGEELGALYDPSTRAYNFLEVVGMGVVDGVIGLQWEGKPWERNRLAL